MLATSAKTCRSQEVTKKWETCNFVFEVCFFFGSQGRLNDVSGVGESTKIASATLSNKMFRGDRATCFGAMNRGLKPQFTTVRRTAARRGVAPNAFGWPRAPSRANPS
jgi:hypothetical protein